MKELKIISIAIGVVAIVVLYTFFWDSSNYSADLTEAEVAHIDSVKTLLKNAPDRSLIDFHKRKIEVITHKDKYGAVYTRGIDRNGYSGDATEPTYYYSDIKSVAYPGTEEHDSLSVELAMGN